MRGSKETSGLGATVRVTLGSGAPQVVEVENRLGTRAAARADGVGTPPTESIPTRKATTDICS